MTKHPTAPETPVGSLHLDRRGEELIRTIAADAYPHECCGILGGRLEGDDRIVTRVLPARNERSDSPRNRYLISPQFHRQADRDLNAIGEQIVGFFHSHPDCPARPSEFDREHAWPWYSYLIVSVVQGTPRELLSWRLRDDRTAFEPQAVHADDLLSRTSNGATSRGKEQKAS